MGLEVVVIGLGKIGKAVKEVFGEWYPGIEGRDIVESRPTYRADTMHICYPYSKDFLPVTLKYIKEYRPNLVIIHTTTPVGTMEQVRKSALNCGIVHMPILGNHKHMAECIRNYKLFIGFDDMDSFNLTSDYLKNTSLRFGGFPSTETSELVKLLSLLQYGLNIEFARYSKKCCDKFHVPYESLTEYIKSLNQTVVRMESMDHVQMVLDPPKGAIGGYCILPAMEKLNAQVPEKYLSEILALNRSLAGKDSAKG